MARALDRPPPRALRFALVAGGSALVLAALLFFGVVTTARRLLRERRALLERALDADVGSTLNTLAQMLAERARDVGDDLHVVTEISEQYAAGDAAATAAVRSSLIALDRATKNYVRFWYLREGEIETEVSGFRASDYPIPEAETEVLRALGRRASATPGRVVTAPVRGDTTDLSLRHFRLFAMSEGFGESTIVLLADLDSMFETLQRRARLPGTDVFVADSELGMVVDANEDMRPEGRRVRDLLYTAPPEGRRRIGPLPSLWPFSERGLRSEVVAWSSTSLDTLRWTIAVAVPLEPITNQLHEFGQRLLLLSAGFFTTLAFGVGVLVWAQRWQLARAEREHQQATIARLRDQLVRAEKLSLIGQLSSGVAHEIGTPLAVIGIRVEQLLAHVALEKHRSALSVIKDEVDRINRIMQQLLDFSRPRQMLSRATPLHASVERVRMLIEHRFDQRDVELSIDVADHLAIEADPDQLEQVLLNLLLNACDACRPHDGVVVRATDVTEPGFVEIRVQDTGHGISVESLPHVFDPFFTTKPHGAGTGLGLTVVREIVENHGGRIAVECEGRGTTFSILWPGAGCTGHASDEGAHEHGKRVTIAC